jgi:serpin B
VTLDSSSVPRDPASTAACRADGDANNAFALKLYGELAPSAHGGNLVTSPLSASLALTMTYAGAQGRTATEMAAALDLPATGASPFDAQNALSQALAGRAAAALAYDQRNSQGSGQTPSPSDYDFTIVNSVWGQKNYPWASPFLDVLARSYGTGVFLEDFVTSPAAAEDTINSWVSSETAKKIDPLLPAGAITSDTRIVLVNAVHLKLPWAQPFTASSTASGTFTRGDGTTVSASFLHGAFEAQYIETASATGVSLPLSGNDLSVVFLQPKTTLADLTSSLTPQTWASVAATQLAGITLALPKFDFTSPTFSLSGALKALGMTSAFDPGTADFKGLCASTPDGANIYIGDVLQKASLAVAENGVEAAAATAVIGLGSAAPGKQVTLTFDHPFVVAIVDSSGAIVFLGQIDDPTAAGGQ